MIRHKIQTLFIANRGEIAVRVIRSARKLGMRVVLGASAADLNSRAAADADEVICVGPAPSSASYLNSAAVVAAAKSAGADAVHPGYGFLSENAAFARGVESAGMVFVGPQASTIDAMGDKLKARAVAQEAGLPVVPGGDADTREQALQVAESVGFPLLIKAASGGGGRGMKRVDNADQLSSQISLAMSEAKAAFGDARVYCEKYIECGRHVEVQILGDGQRAVHLGTRDCSIQRRFQKLVEEAPAPGIPDPQRAAIENAAVTLAEHLNYRGAGTVEFLMDAQTFEFYFLEMNARIQVEHPVTEAITGVDLVEQQLLIATGAPLTLQQQDLKPEGHAIEVRINAEDPQQDFRPCPGKVSSACWPAGPGIRVDTHIRSGDVIAPNYDSLLGKVIIHGCDRDQALERMQRALSCLTLEGISTTAELHQRIMADPGFRAGAVDTRFFERF